MIKLFIQQLQDFFGISRKEARAALVLMIFSFCLLWTPFIFRRYILPLFPVSTTPVNTQHLDSLATELNKNAEETEFNTSDYKTESKKDPARPTRLFTFDPNQATTDQFEELGIPKFIAKRIDKYRSKGGQFRKKEDLLHIYDFPSAVYQRIEPYITIRNNSPEKKQFSKNDYKSSETYPSNRYNKEARPNIKPTLAPFDINTADTTQLIKLKGIGTKLSMRILKFRDGLGGFHSASQFSEIFGLDSVAMAELNKYAKINSPVTKLNINTATADQLSNHSYLRNKKLASVIVNYRDQHGPYKSADDLLKIRILDPQVLEKIKPYLEF
jgi:competence protein ComEA